MVRRRMTIRLTPPKASDLCAGIKRTVATENQRNLRAISSCLGGWGEKEWRDSLQDRDLGQDPFRGWVEPPEAIERPDFSEEGFPKSSIFAI